MQDQISTLQKVKKGFLIAALVLLSSCTLLSIALVMVGATTMHLRIIGTTLILGIFLVAHRERHFPNRQ